MSPTQCISGISCDSIHSFSKSELHDSSHHVCLPLHCSSSPRHRAWPILGAQQIFVEQMNDEWWMILCLPWQPRINLISLPKSFHSVILELEMISSTGDSSINWYFMFGGGVGERYKWNTFWVPEVVTIFIYYFISSSWPLSEVGSVMIST